MISFNDSAYRFSHFSLSPMFLSHYKHTCSGYKPAILCLQCFHLMINVHEVVYIPYFFLFQYSAVDTSPVSKYITHPFWNWVVEVGKDNPVFVYLFF